MNLKEEALIQVTRLRIFFKSLILLYVKIMTQIKTIKLNCQKKLAQ